MSETANLVVKGELTIKQVYNALKRLNIKPILSEEEITNDLLDSFNRSVILPIEAGGVTRRLFLWYMPNPTFKVDVEPYIRGNSRKFKGTKKGFLNISLDANHLATRILIKLAQELDGGYVQINDCAEGKFGEYQLINSKHNQ